MSSDENSEEWKPPEPKPKAQRKTTRVPAAGEKKAAAKRTAKPRVPKEPNAPKVARGTKPRAPCKPAAEPKTQGPKCLKDSEASVLPGMKRKKMDEGKKQENAREKQINSPEEKRAEESGPSIRMKEEVRCIPIYGRKSLCTPTSISERSLNTKSAVCRSSVEQIVLFSELTFSLHHFIKTAQNMLSFAYGYVIL